MAGLLDERADEQTQRQAEEARTGAARTGYGGVQVQCGYFGDRGGDHRISRLDRLPVKLVHLFLAVALL